MQNLHNLALEQKTSLLKHFIDFIGVTCDSGDLEKLQSLQKMIVEHFYPLDDANERILKHMPLRNAAFYGHLHLVKYLIPLSVFDDKSDALNSAARNGHVECLQALIPYYQPHMLSIALTEAVCTNHVNCVTELLKHNPPNFQNTYEICLIWASARKNMELLEYFYTCCNPSLALDIIEKDTNQYGEAWWNNEQLEMLQHYHSSEAQRERLEESVGNVSTQRDRKAKM